MPRRSSSAKKWFFDWQDTDEVMIWKYFYLIVKEDTTTSYMAIHTPCLAIFCAVHSALQCCKIEKLIYTFCYADLLLLTTSLVTARIYLHSSEIRGLCSTKCSSETLHNLLYFMYKKTHVVFFIFSTLYF